MTDPVTILKSVDLDLGRKDSRGRRIGLRVSVVRVDPALYGSDKPVYYSAAWRGTRDGRGFGVGGTRRFGTLAEAEAFASKKLAGNGSAGQGS